MSDPYGIGAMAGGLISGAFAVKGQKRANKQARKEAVLNRAFQERMSSTAYRRGMQDMREAGLNPMLAFSQGGASSPMGSIAPMKNIYGGLSADISMGVTSGAKAIEALTHKSKLKSEIENIKSNTAANIAQAGYAAQQTNTSAATQGKIIEETKILESQTPYREDKAYGDIPWSGKVKRAWSQRGGMIDAFINSGREAHRKNHEAHQRRRQ